MSGVGRESSHPAPDRFELWDEDGNGHVSGDEFRRGIRMLRLKPTEEEVDQLLAKADVDGSGQLSMQELRTLLNTDTVVDPGSPEKPKDQIHWQLDLRTIKWVLQTNSVQALLYLAFIGVFQSLVYTLRLKEEVSLSQPVYFHL